MIYKNISNFYSEGPFSIITEVGKVNVDYYGGLELYIIYLSDIKEYFKVMPEEKVVRFFSLDEIEVIKPTWFRKLRYAIKSNEVRLYFDIELIESNHEILELENQFRINGEISICD